MIDDALEVATDPDYRFDLAMQLGSLEIAKVSGKNFNPLANVSSHYERFWILPLISFVGVDLPLTHLMNHSLP